MHVKLPDCKAKSPAAAVKSRITVVLSDFMPQVGKKVPKKPLPPPEGWAKERLRYGFVNTSLRCVVKTSKNCFLSVNPECKVVFVDIAMSEF